MAEAITACMGPIKVDTAKKVDVDIRQEKFPTERVALPSKGLLYPEGSGLEDGYIEMRYMTTKEEDILSTQSYIQSGVVIDKLFQSMIASPIDYNSLVVGDKNAIMIAARMYGYGPDYSTVVKTEEGTEIPIQINLAEIGHKQFNESLVTKGQNLFKFTTPQGGNVLEFKLLTVKDQNDLVASQKNLRKLGPGRADNQLTMSLRKMILSVDGDSSEDTLAKFITNMRAYDSRAFREYVESVQPDIDLSIELEDPNTGEPFRGDIEIGLNLFYPDYKKPK